MSTAFERIMRERGDFECLHEPFLHYYYLERSQRPLPHFASDGGHPSSFRETRDLILQKAESGPVFAKDMSYYVVPELFEEHDFCRRVQHCFLIRNPRRSIMSYYKLDPDLSLPEIGLEAQWQHYCRLLDVGIQPGPVVEAEAVQDNSSGMMRSFWRILGIEYREQALAWKREEVPDDWEYVQGWHQSVSQSQGIRPAPADDEARALREFDELAQKAPQLRDYLEHHLPFYRHLQRHAIKPQQHGIEL